MGNDSEAGWTRIGFSSPTGQYGPENSPQALTLLSLITQCADKKKRKSKFGERGPSAFCRRASIEKTNYPKLCKRFGTNRSDASGWERYLRVTAKLTLTPATTSKTFTRQRDRGDNAALFRLMKTLTFPLAGHRCVACGRSPNSSVGTQYLLVPTTGCLARGRGQRRPLTPTTPKASSPLSSQNNILEAPGQAHAEFGRLKVPPFRCSHPISVFLSVIR